MYRIAIVEDDNNDAGILFRILNRYGVEKKIEFHIDRYVNSEAFLFEYKKNYDIVFMDIMMPGTNGMDSAAQLRKVDPDVILIFITTMARMAIRGYEVNALDFILKPIEYPSFSLKLDRAFSNLRKNLDRTVLIKSKNGIEKIQELDIVYLEVLNHTVIYHLVDRKIEANTSLKSAMIELSKIDFFKSNNCYVVNMNHISRIEGYTVTLDREITLPVSHPKRAEFVKAFHRFVQGV